MNYKLELNDFISLINNSDVDFLSIKDAYQNNIKCYCKGDITTYHIDNGQKYRHSGSNTYYTAPGSLKAFPRERHNFNIIKTLISIFSNQIVLLLGGFDSTLEWFNRLNKLYNEFSVNHFGLEITFYVNGLRLFLGHQSVDTVCTSDYDWWLDCGDYRVNPSFCGANKLVFVNYMGIKYSYNKYKELESFI